MTRSERVLAGLDVDPCPHNGRYYSTAMTASPKRTKGRAEAMKLHPHAVVEGRPVTNPYYERIKRDGMRICADPPRRGEGSGPTVARSVRLAPKLWKLLEDRAARSGLTRHGAIRQALLIWLRS
jgi:hypothetical protein